MKREILAITDRGAWLRWRSRDLTASRIAALFDRHPFLTRAELAKQLRAGARDFDNPSMRAGRILEPGVAVAMLERDRSRELTKCNAYYRLTEQRIGATPDYFDYGDGLVEIATVAPDEWNGRPPFYKVLQTHVQLMTTDRARGCIAVMIRQFPDLPLHIFDVPRDPEIERCILDAAAAWWPAFDRGELPPAVPLPPALAVPAPPATTAAAPTPPRRLPAIVHRHRPIAMPHHHRII